MVQTSASYYKKLVLHVTRAFFKTRYMEEVHTRIVSMKNPFTIVHVRSHRTSSISFYPFTRDELSPVFFRKSKKVAAVEILNLKEDLTNDFNQLMPTVKLHPLICPYLCLLRKKLSPRFVL